MTYLPREGWDDDALKHGNLTVIQQEPLNIFTVDGILYV